MDWLLTDQGECLGKKLLEEIVTYDNLKYFKIPAVQILIMFIYTQVVIKVMLTIVPNVIDLILQIIQLAIFDSLLSEDNRLPTKDKKTLKWKSGQFIVFQQGLQVIVASGQIVLLLMEIYRFIRKLIPDMQAGNKRIGVSRRIFYQIATMIPRLVVVIISIKFFVLAVQYGRPVTVWDIIWLRNMLAISIVLQTLSIFSYMRLIEEAAKLEDLMTHLLGKIKAFSFMVILLILSFAVPFYIIGQNQIDFEINNEMELLDNDIARYKHAMPNT